MVRSDARCAVHPEVAAVEICSRCGGFVCSECLELEEQSVLCPSCLNRSGSRGAASGRAIASLILGILGLNCGFLPGIIGLVLAVQELAAIEQGSAPPGGRNLARGGKILGYVNIGLLGLVVLIGIAIGVGAARHW